MSGKESKGDIKLGTAPFDARFPNTNQTRNCWQNYVDFHRCQNLKGQEYEPCSYFRKIYQALCPDEWIEKWDSQRETRSFPARL